LGKRARRRPELRQEQILAWADAHRRRHGSWPTSHGGPVWGAPGETWPALNMALRTGLRGLPGGYSLALLLRRERGVGERRGRPRRGCLVIDRLRARGLTLAEIGRHLGVSRQAIFQRLARRAG
jgi:hypothetical protein